MISKPILHDIIKSELCHNYKQYFELCKTFPEVNNSNLFKKDYWTLREARQEQFNQRFYQADCVWYFEGKKNDYYYIIHEVKTGNYSVLDILNKYHIGMAGQIWIWGWRHHNDLKIIGSSYQRQIKRIPIENIAYTLQSDLLEIIGGLGA
jgi:hypothetical protein